MKVLHVSSAFYPGFSHGGIIPAFYELCRSLDRMGCDVKVLTTDASGNGTPMDVNCAGEVELAERFHVRYCRYWAARSVSPTLLQLLPRYVRWADVVHLSSVYNFPTIPTLALCRLMGKPLVWSPHGAFQRWEGSRRKWLKTIWEAICRAVAPKNIVLHVTSEQEANVSQARFPGAARAIIPYCIEIPEDVRHIEGNGILDLLYLGRLDPKKGIENLLRACKMVQDRSLAVWSLTIAGGGKSAYAARLRTCIESLGLQAHVRMAGEVTGAEKERLFQHADVLVVPSYTENFGVVVAEALARGVPVIAGTGTPWKKIEENECGLWVANDTESLAKAIERMRYLPRREMGLKGRELVKREFMSDGVAEQTIASYERLATSSGVKKFVFDSEI